MGKVDCITGGFPCQPFSVVGQRNADKDPSHLFPHIARAVKVIRPRLVVLENVPGILSTRLEGKGWRDSSGTPVALHVTRELERLDYIVVLQLASANEVGLPHKRQRVFFVAVHRDLVPDSTRVGRNGFDGPRHAEEECLRKTCAAVGKGHAVRPETRSSCTLPAPVSGPGQVQQPWEYPRVIDLNAKTSRVSVVGGAGNGNRSALGCSAAALRDPATWQTAMRLCGNGVVPAVAELAIRRGLKEIFCSKV